MTQPAPTPIQRRPAAPRHRRWPWVAGLVVLVLAAAGVWYFVLRDDGAGQEVVTTTGGGFTRPTQDGAIIFTVTMMRCGLAKVGDELVDIEARGAFCLIDVLVKNNGTKAVHFDSTAQKAYDTAGIEYSIDKQAEVYANPDVPNFLDEIKPGIQIKGTLVFDIPDEAVLSFVMLHESFSSKGAPIALQ